MLIPRRSFLKGTAATAAVSLIGGNAMEALAVSQPALAKGVGNKWEGRVVVNFNKEAASGLTANETVIKQMVNDSIKFLTDQTTIGLAWKSLFPSTLTLQSKIAIKINILNAGNPAPHPSSVMAITEGLQQIDIGGTKFPATNITIYDMNNRNTMDTVGYSAARFPNISRVKDTAQVWGDGAMNNRSYARTLNDADFLINVFSPRGQSSDVENFTLGFKSHFGTYSNPSSLHNSPARAALRDFNCIGPVFNKTVLSMCSGVFGMNEGHGPNGGKDDYSTYSRLMDSTSANVNPTTIIMSTDPVSCEMQTIKMMRMNNGKSYALADLPAYLKASAGISGALTPTYNIGIINENQMDVRKIINGEPIATSVKDTLQSTRTQQLQLSTVQLKNQKISFVEFSVLPSDINHNAVIEILTLQGEMVQQFTQKIQGIANHFSWDERDMRGVSVKSGTYIVNLKVPTGGTSSRLVLTR